MVFCISCGATKKFNFFPVQYIAGNAKCSVQINDRSMANKIYQDYLFSSKGVRNETYFNYEGYRYDVTEWTKTKIDCSEPNGYFTIGEHLNLARASPLIAFGFSKAVMNFV